MGADLSMHAALPSIDEYARAAQVRLEPGIWHYLQEGDSPALGAALRETPLMPRPLRVLSGGHTRLQLLGSALEHPILLAPVAYQRLFHADGEQASAMAAAAQGTQMVISSLASQPIGDIAHTYSQTAEPHRTRIPWFQLYWQGARAPTLRLLQRAQHAGCSAIVFTVDAPIKRASLVLPAHIAAVNLEPGDALPAGASQVFDGWMQRAPTWDDVHWLREQTRLPLLLKGLMHPQDAEAAVAAGCDGVIVSSHGGRVLCGTPPILHALRAIAQQVGARVPVLMDSGVRSGRDVFVALAAGASAVLVGRPYVWGLAAQGAWGVARVLRLLRDELEMTMALTGCATLEEIQAGCCVA